MSTTTETLHSAEIEWVYVSGTIAGAGEKYMKRLMMLYRVGGVSMEGNTSIEPCGKHHNGDKL